MKLLTGKLILRSVLRTFPPSRRLEARVGLQLGMILIFGRNARCWFNGGVWDACGARVRLGRPGASFYCLYLRLVGCWDNLVEKTREAHLLQFICTELGSLVREGMLELGCEREIRIRLSY